jgi:hypothetical protein
MYRQIGSEFRGSLGAAVVIMLTLFCAVAATAQMEVGDSLSMKLSGDVGFGYSGTAGNSTQDSGHGFGLTGEANLTGFYFHPNFLSFQFRPYYDRNQTNNDSQIVTRGTGLGGTVSLFGGSYFPGSISYGKGYSSNTEFRLAGIPSVSGNSSGQDFSVSWSSLVPRFPLTTLSYSIGSSDSSVADLAESQSSAKNLSMTSSYQLVGFNLQGSLSHNSNNFSTPGFLTSQPIRSGGAGLGFGLSAQHALPLRGSVSLGWSHSKYSNDNGSEWGTNNYTLSNTFALSRRVSVYQSGSYTTNLSGALAQNLLLGTGAFFVRPDNDSKGLFYNAGTNVLVTTGITVGGHFTHRIQWLGGERYEDTQYGGNVNFNYNSRLFGVLYMGVGMVDSASKMGNEGAGLTGTLGMTKKFGHWDTSADFNYSQNIQTMGTILTTSSYTYGGSVRRRLNQDTQFGAAYRSSHSALVVQSGSGNSSESVSGNFGWKRYNVGSSYSQSSGTAVLNSAGGLTPTPIGSVISDDFLLFNARSLSMSVSTRLIRRINVSGSYAKFKSSTEQGSAGLFSSGTRYSFRSEYRLRKFSLLGGYNRSMQDISSIPGGPRVVNSYYLSLSRWFNVF